MDFLLRVKSNTIEIGPVIKSITVCTDQSSQPKASPETSFTPYNNNVF